MTTSSLRAPIVAAFAALALVACSENPTSPDMAAQLAKGGVSNPNTEVNATFVIYIEGQEVLLPVGTAVNGGTCLEGGVFSNHDGHGDGGAERRIVEAHEENGSTLPHGAGRRLR